MAFCAGSGTTTLLSIIILKRNFNSDSSANDFAGKNAYDVLGVSETSSFAEIKASFRKLAKETHPDLLGSSTDPIISQRFVQILAAYEILSDSEKRVHYDRHLFSQRKVVLKHSRQGYFDELEGEFYSAIHAAYYGPVIESMDLLPDSFEAEERSVNGTPEVLHLVSGRYLFGIVCLVNKLPELSNACCGKLTSFTSVGSGLCQYVKNVSSNMSSGSLNNAGMPQMNVKHHLDCASDVYKDLELNISGRVVAVASRIPPKSCCNGIQNEDSQDHIHVFLSSPECPMNSISGSTVGSRSLLGTITGLGTNAEEGSCFVYDDIGTKTHVVLKHRTLLVKHMHWFQVEDEGSVCECRCSRARLPPSKFWLFEPRCGMHDIGGWYVETFGQDKKGRAVPSQRHWDGFDANEQPEK